MEMPGNSIVDAANTTSAREPHGDIGDLDDFMRREELNVHKLLKEIMDDLDQKNALSIVPDSPYFNSHPMRPSEKGPPVEKTPVFSSFDELPAIKPVLDKWPSYEMDCKNFDFQVPTPPPPRSSGFYMVRAFGSVVGVIVLLMIIAGIRSGKTSRTRRGRFTGAGAVQRGRPDYPRQPSGQGEPGRPLNDDLPPSYACALSSIKKNVSEEPPSYANYKAAEPQVHAHRQNALIENGLGAKAVTMTTTSNDSGYVAPEMKTELVFDNGRIVETLSLDLNGNTDKTEIASNDNVDQQSSHADVKDTVVYVDETDNVTVNTQ